MKEENQPLVSVITVCLNSRKYLEEAIKSLSEQTYLNIEYIVIDGGSTDGSIDILNKYRNKINKIVVEKDNGIFDAMNKGIKLANGDIIYFLNSDDRFYNNQVVEKAVTAFSRHKEGDFIYGNIIAFNPATGYSYIERYPKKISKWLFIRKTIGHPATFFRSSCFKKAGYFDERYKIAADYEWYLRVLFVKKLKSRHIKDNISIFRLGGISNNRKHSEVYISERKIIQKKYFNSFELACADGLEKLKRINRCLKMRT